MKNSYVHQPSRLILSVTTTGYSPDVRHSRRLTSMPLMRSPDVGLYRARKYLRDTR